MNKKVTIIMYHYVRDLKGSMFPEIKGLDISLFKEQLEYLQRYYSIIGMDHLIAAMTGSHDLPEKASLLTFDDGFIDHYSCVFPMLRKKNIRGSFYPSARPVRKKIVLDVHKIHFLLASVKDKSLLVKAIFKHLDKSRQEYKLPGNDDYFNMFAVRNRFDCKEVVFIKRLLQVELPEKLRGYILNKLFGEYVTSDEAGFSRELYMSIGQIKEMKDAGMHIGSHSFDHRWLDSLNVREQEAEIRSSVEFLEEIGAASSYMTITYPYGAYDADTINILRKNEFKAALTSEVDIANLDRHDAFELPRLDTNDLPKDRHSMANIWYERA